MVDFSILRQPDYAAAALGGFQAGAAIGKQRRTEAALGALSERPDDPRALNGLAAVDPAAAKQYLGFRSDMQANTRDTAFRGALTDWQMAGRKGRTQRTLGDVMRQNGGSPQTVGTGAGNEMPPPLGAGGAPMQPPGPAGFSLGGAAPVQDGPSEDDAYARMIQADPVAAMSARESQAKLTKSDIDAWQEVNSASLQMMGGVHDQATYDTARQQAHELHDRYGVGLDHFELPEKYDPEMVKGLMKRAMNTSQQLSAIRADNRLAWDVQDDEADNARADRNTSSLIDDRGQRRGLIARGQDLTDARGRRGQDLQHGDRVRGQDKTDARVRATRTAPGGGQKFSRIATNAAGQKMGYNGKAWVPVL